MDIVARLKRYMGKNGIPVSVLADTAQISRPTLSQILSGRNKKVSNEVISKLHAAFPDLNIMWLLFGDGDMEVDANKETSGGQNGLFGASLGTKTIDFEQDIDKTTANKPSSNPEQTKDSDMSLVDSAMAEFDLERNQRTNSAASSRNPSLQSNVPMKEYQRVQARETGISFHPDTTKKVQQIMVFYSDNSFEIFTPAGK